MAASISRCPARGTRRWTRTIRWKTSASRSARHCGSRWAIARALPVTVTRMLRWTKHSRGSLSIVPEGRTSISKPQGRRTRTAIRHATHRGSGRRAVHQGSARMIAVIDYGAGNLRSISRALETVGADVVVTSDPDVVRSADAVVLPGVGHAGHSIQTLSELGMPDAIHEVVEQGKPFLGICV